jgi:hypothetical protein
MRFFRTVAHRGAPLRARTSPCDSHPRARVRRFHYLVGERTVDSKNRPSESRS